MAVPRELELVFCASGIYVFYLLFGIYQEEIMSMRWGPNKERFNYTSFLLFIQSVVNALCAGLVILFASKSLPPHNIPVTKYIQVSLTSIAAMFFSNRALMYVDYPTQVLTKSCKPIPVMLMGVVIFRKRYSLMKYICVFAVTVGIGLFMLPEGKHNHKAVQTESTTEYMLGLALLAASLACDGATGPFQDELIRKYHPSSPHLMFYSNLWASLAMFVFVLISGDLQPAISFCIQYPQVIIPISLFSICSALGQNFIYYTIQQFGSLTCTTVTTTRKFFTILASVLWFGHYVSPRQWFAVSLVFLGLGCETVFGYLEKKKSPPHRHKEQ